MRKLLSIIVLSTVLLGLTAGMILAQAGPPQKLKEYCELGTRVKITSGEVLKSGNIIGTSINCVTDAAGTTKRSLNYICTKGDGACYFQKGCTVGKTANTPAPTPTDPSATVRAAIGSWGMVCLLNTIQNVTNWIFYLMLIAVVLAGVIGGALYMTAAGDAEKAGKGKNIILYAIIGLILALVARLVPSVVRLIMGM